MPQVNPQDGTETSVDEVVVVGRRTLKVYYVYPPFPEDDNTPGPVLPDVPEAPEPPDQLDEDCRRQAALNRAVLEAGDRIGSDGSESGYLLVRGSDGGVRAIGPFDGAAYDQTDWPQNPSAYGLDDFSNVVGLVHNHPRQRGTVGLDPNRSRFSEADAEVNAFFLGAGVSPDFRQFVVVGSQAWVFDNDAEEGDEGADVEPTLCPGASLS